MFVGMVQLLLLETRGGGRDNANSQQVLHSPFFCNFDVCTNQLTRAEQACIIPGHPAWRHTKFGKSRVLHLYIQQATETKQKSEVAALCMSMKHACKHSMCMPLLIHKWHSCLCLYEPAKFKICGNINL
jgi:hypothetical protein